ncbi:MAG: PIN domain-containing protein [Thermoplasmatota archaeon]
MFLDTNVLVSANISDGLPRRILACCVRRHHQFLVSPPVVEEFVDVIRRPKFRLIPREIERAVTVVVQTAEVIQVVTNWMSFRTPTIMPSWSWRSMAKRTCLLRGTRSSWLCNRFVTFPS